MALKITDPRDEEGAAHAGRFIAIVVVPGSDRGEGHEDTTQSVHYLYPGDHGYDMTLSMLRMLEAADEDALAKAQ